MNVSINSIVERWSDPNARPLFKGCLIDSEGCCCAQGDVLRVAGFTDAQLRDLSQSVADREVAKLLDISVAHAVLLRIVNDRADGCPQDVLTHPEKVLGDKAQIILAFWKHLDSLSPERWREISAAAGAAARDAAWAAARDAAWAAARAAARDAAGDAAWAAAAGAAARAAARAAAGAAARDAAGDAAWAAAARDAAGDAAWAAARAANEIQGMDIMLAKGQQFYFLAKFGFAKPQDIPLATEKGDL